jgi:dipeptidyl aminopeptidase/acylaminoacyl peptidase
MGFLLTPPGAQKNEALPLIVYVEGGPTMPDSLEFENSYRHYPWPQFLDHGMAVFIPITRGRQGFGSDFRRKWELGGFQLEPARDVISGVEQLIRQGRVDPRRIGITGHSYGGAIVASATQQSPLFAAASIHEGGGLYMFGPDAIANGPWWTDMVKDYGLPSPLDEAGRADMIAESPGYHADQTHSPTLLEYGILTGGTAGARAYYQALQHFGVPSELVVYPRTSHNTTEPALIADHWRRNLEWFDYWLNGVASEHMLKLYGPRSRPQ